MKRTITYALFGIFLMTTCTLAKDPTEKSDPYRTLTDITIVLKQDYADKIKSQIIAEDTTIAATSIRKDGEFFIVTVSDKEADYTILIIPTSEILLIKGRNKVLVF